MGKNMKKKCKCDWCTKWYPTIKRLDKKLTGKLKKDFDDLMTHYIGRADDGDVAQAKLDGSWPGYEWMPAEIKRHWELYKAEHEKQESGK